MKVVAVNGSPRKNGNVSQMIQIVFQILQEEGIETEEIRVADVNLSGCIDCRMCRRPESRGICVLKGDDFNAWIKKLEAADGIILASPTYVGGVSGQLKCFMDRACRVTRSSHSLQHKVGAPLIAARRGGATMVFNSLMAFFTTREMIVPCSDYWNYCLGHDRGEIMSDQEGLQSVRILAANMAGLLKKLHA